MKYYTTFENWEHAAIHMYLEILPNIRSMVWVLPYYPTYMNIDRVKAAEIRKEWLKQEV